MLSVFRSSLKGERSPVHEAEQKETHEPGGVYIDAAPNTGTLFRSRNPAPVRYQHPPGQFSTRLNVAREDLGLQLELIPEGSCLSTAICSPGWTNA